MKFTRIAHLPFVQIVERVLEGKEDEALTIIYLLGISKDEFDLKEPKRAIAEFFWNRKSDFSASKLAFLQFCLSHLEHEWHSHFCYRAEELLIWANEKGYSRIVLALIIMGVNPEISSFNGMQAISYAAKRGNLDVLRACQDVVVDINCEDRFGTTPLMYAAASGQDEAVDFLIERKAIINAIDNSHQNALIHASRHGHVKCAESLLRAGAGTEYSDRRGNTPLIWAVFKNNLPIVDLLISEGASLSPKNHVGQTALIVANGLESNTMVDYLRTKMYEMDCAELRV